MDRHPVRVADCDACDVLALGALIASERAGREKAEAERDEARALNNRVICTWCGWTMQKEDIEDVKDKILDHMATCEKRPEARMAAERDAAFATLWAQTRASRKTMQTYGHHLQGCVTKKPCPQDRPLPICDCGFDLACANSPVMPDPVTALAAFGQSVLEACTGLLDFRGWDAASYAIKGIDPTILAREWMGVSPGPEERP